MTYDSHAARSPTPDAVLSSLAVRAFDSALEGADPGFAVRAERIDPLARTVARALIRRSSGLRLPPYGPLYQLDADGFDRRAALSGRLDAIVRSAEDRAARLADLTALAVLLDGDPGPGWRVRTRTGAHLHGDRGILLVAFNLFVQGALSGVADDPLRVDAARLASLEEGVLQRAFAGEGGALPEGLSPRVERLRAVGEALVAVDPSARLSDPVLAETVATAPDDSPAEVLLAECGRLLRPAFASPDRDPRDPLAMSLLDARALSLAASLAPLLAGPEQIPRWTPRALPPDPWSLSLLLDGGVLAPPEGAPAEPRAPHAPSLAHLRAVASGALSRVASEVRALVRMDEARLSSGSILAFGVVPAGRALAALRRPGGPPALFPVGGEASQQMVILE
jgi:hypothetical protein